MNISNEFPVMIFASEFNDKRIVEKVIDLL